MSKYFKLPACALLLLALGLSLPSCDDGFAELNTNPNTSDQLASPFLLNFAINRGGSSRYETWRGNLIYTSQWAQQLSGSWSVDNYNTSVEDWLSAYWNTVYGDYMRNLETIITQDEGTNAEAMAMIMKVLFMQRITDMYGDIPYSEAFQGGIVPQPEYDTQEEVYDQFIEQLRTAIAQLDAGGDDVGTFDGIYNGDTDKWRKFGNSMLLRVGLRLSEVDPAKSEMIVREAIEGGIISSQDEVAFISFDGSMPDGVVASGIGEVFNDFGIGGGAFALSDELVTRLQDAEDPRLGVIGVKYVDNTGATENIGQDEFLGKPNGADIDNLFDFVMPNHSTMVSYAAPVIYYGWAEAEFNRAEAIARGWASGSAEEAYNTGVTAAFRQLELYPGVAAFAQDDIDDVLDDDSVSFDDDDALERINTQKWIALLFDGFEGYANLRRTGFPEVSPGLTAGESNGEIPKRLRYPASEPLTNKANYDVAVSRLQGGDVITAPLWWDVD